MKYVNANDVLPEELLSMIQKHYQGGYLYIPKGNYCEVKQKTDYKIELEKRNQHIYLKHLEGRTNGQLGNIYHLSEASIRRIISKEKVKYQKMKEIIEQILSLWGIENKQLLQIYPSAWEINQSYVLKVYDDRKQLERNIKISEILLGCNIPVAKIILTKTEEKYVAYQNNYFLMSKKLRGSNISDIKDKTIAWKMGCAIAQLHTAFIKCEREVEFWDNSLLKEMKGWIRENLANNEWKILNEEDYSKTVELLESVYDYLPKQLIHRDVHFGNFLFFEGNLSGYIDFDLSQRNIRIFDICYFLTGLLAEETDNAFTKIEWIEYIKSVIAGYESIINLSEKEKNAIPCVMKCIEILCVAYFISMKDTKHANDAYNVFHLIQNCESDIKNTI
ncbi:MAG: phosphotransferase [Lachnospiraceae bacterium]|nr:phosphotransferase [Lachnospiraceae bacterium]